MSSAGLKFQKDYYASCPLWEPHNWTQTLFLYSPERTIKYF